MHKRQLGTDGPQVGAIGLGCMSFGGFYGPTDEAESHATLARALELGCDFLDTSNVYGAGLSERVMGSFIAQHPGQFKIATKAGIRRTPEKGRFFDNSPEHLREALEASFQRLGVDYVDLFYIHRRETDRPIEEVMETLVALKQEGKIGGIGFSEISPASLRRAHAVHPVMAVQSEYSLWTRLPELGMLQTCKELGVTFVPFSPVARGMLTDTPPDPKAFSDDDFRKRNPRFMEPNFSYNEAQIKKFRAYAHELGLSTAALAMAWILNQGDHLVPIPGTRSAEHLEDDLAAADRKLSAAELAHIETLLPVGFAHGDRYNEAQNIGPERYC